MTVRPEIRDQGRNKWGSILQHFGVDAKLLTGKHGPCPLCGGRDRFRFDNDGGRGTWICRDGRGPCGSGDGMELVLKVTGLSFADAAKQIREHIGEFTEAKPKREHDPAAVKRDMEALWIGSAPITAADEGGRYLAGRGLPGPYPRDLRFCPSARVSGHPSRGFLPAIVALVREPNGTVVNIHRTYLENNWKARMDDPRRLFPAKLPPGSAIRLGDHGGHLGAAEGIETALAAKRDFGITCWATINSTMMEKFVLPDGVTEFSVFGDNDVKLGGQKAAYALGHRVAVSPNPPLVRVRIPLIAGTDWADPKPQEQAA
jgi:putative DNA primase/helicase